jgi:hypothetical protein
MKDSVNHLRQCKRRRCRSGCSANLRAAGDLRVVARFTSKVYPMTSSCRLLLARLSGWWRASRRLSLILSVACLTRQPISLCKMKSQLFCKTWLRSYLLHTTVEHFSGRPQVQRPHNFSQKFLECGIRSSSLSFNGQAEKPSKQSGLAAGKASRALWNAVVHHLG